MKGVGGVPPPLFPNRYAASHTQRVPGTIMTFLLLRRRKIRNSLRFPGSLLFFFSRAIAFLDSAFLVPPPAKGEEKTHFSG